MVCISKYLPKKILYKTRGVKSRLFPLGQTKELKWDEHLAARSLPKTHSGKKKAYQKSYGSLYRTKHKELSLLKNFPLEKYKPVAIPVGENTTLAALPAIPLTFGFVTAL